MRVLLSEGSSLTSRQVATRLGAMGHHVEILSSSRLCLTRFTRHVRKVHLVPLFATEPLAWLEAASEIAERRAVDVLLPTHDQVAVLAAKLGDLDCAMVAPSFQSLRRVQDKISASITLQEVGIPQPDFVIARSFNDLTGIARFPVFVKQPISTASTGVRRATTPTELQLVAGELGLGTCALLIQDQSSGPLAMVQAVFDSGHLVAHHANLRIRVGVGGGASFKESITLPSMAEHLEKLAHALNWHGALSADVIVTPEGPVAIDVNPRLVEPMNAYFSGVDLVAAMLDLAQRNKPRTQPPGRAGVRSRQLLLAILGAAQARESRWDIAQELVYAARGFGQYAGAREELTPISGDPMAAVPVIAAAASTLVWPPLWRAFQSGAVGSYALSPEAWAKIAAADGSGASASFG